MKKRLYLLCLIHSIVLFCTGQSVPGLFNYQIAVRNAEGLPISNRLMSFQVSIADNLNGSNPIFIETYNQNTNNNGIASFQIGSGTRVGSSVSLSKVPFLQNKFFISIEVDTNNGNNFKTISTTQLISVPYAMTSDSANFALNARQLDRNGANLDQVLKWDGQKWAPKNDSLGTGSNTYISGTGIEIKSGVISNSGDTDANNDITNVTAAGGDLSGTFPNLKVTGIQNNPISTNTPSLGQVLKWDGSKWRPSNDSLGSGSVALIAGNGISIANGRISNIGDIDSLNDITTTTKAGGDLRGNYTNPIVNKIQGDSVSTIQPSNDQVLQWDSQNSVWVPKTIQIANSGWLLTGNATNDAHFIGTTTNNNLYFKCFNKHSGMLGLVNTSYGLGSLEKNSNGKSNTAIGIRGLFNNLDGSYNIAIGDSALFNNTRGSDNIAIGFQSLNDNTTGFRNIAIGNSTLRSNEIGNSNIAIGYGIGIVGSCNTVIGSRIFAGTMLGDSNTIIGFDSGFGINNIRNSTAIGRGSFVDASNKVWIGGPGTTYIGGPRNWNTTSDGRFKENIKTDIPGLCFINQLNPVSYCMNIDKIQHHITSTLPDSIAKRYYPTDAQIRESNNSIQSGFIAQEVEAAARKVGYNFDGVTPPQNSSDTYSLAYGSFVPSIVKAIQEQQVLIESQNRTIEELNVKIADLDQLKVKLVLMESELAKIKEILLKNEK